MSKYYCNPINFPYRFQFVRHKTSGEKDFHVYREAADPSLILFKGTYFMFPSMTNGFLTSDDLVNWEHHEYVGEMPIHDYAPDVRAIGDYIYFCASRRGVICDFYRSKDPRIDGFERLPGTFDFWDPDMFSDDDGRLYFYWGCGNTDPIHGVELDSETMKPLCETVNLIDSAPKTRGYERIGMDHIVPKTEEQVQAEAEAMITRMLSAPMELRIAQGMADDEVVKRVAYGFCGTNPYIEGAWMTKHEGKYYLQYAIPGTEYNTYGDGVYVSDSPLGPFTPQQSNPYSYKPGGFMNGAGHGSTLKDKNGNYWHTSTMAITVNDTMERRVGLWKAGFDKDGEMFCDQRFGDWPVNVDGKPWDKPEFMLLSFHKKVSVSSGTGAENITDEKAKTFWKADENDNLQQVVVDLEMASDIRGIQINFMEDGIRAELPENAEVHSDYDDRFIEYRSQTTCWNLEGSLDGENYFPICDKRNVDTDLTHEYLDLSDGISARYIRLTVTHMAYDMPACVSGIRVFGKKEGSLPKETTDVKFDKLSEMDVIVSWKESDDAIAHNILWGISPDKLYHSYLVYEKNEQRIGALVAGQKVFFRVDSVNECGITEGEIYEY